MKDLPPLAGWPTQTSFVKGPKEPLKKKSMRRSKKTHRKSK
jgi:hypothetical protein